MQNNTSHPTPYKSLEEILAARVPKSEDIALAHSDCLILAPFPDSNGGLWISSPNMEFVPEPPTHEDGVPFSFFADGMLGAFEHLKWPQVFDEREPHAIAVPGNPDLMLNVKIQEFPLLDAKGILPDFEDKDIPWLAIDSKDFDVALRLPQEDVGFLTSSMHARLRKAASEVIAWAITEADDLSRAGAQDVLQPEQWALRRKNIVLRDADMLRRALSRLQETPMSSFDVLMWFRECQRLILALRGWLTYTSVVRPRLDDPDFGDYDNVLPLRGIFTRKESMVQTMFRCGVPVWWVRPLHTLTDHITIIRVHNPVRSAVSFSSQKVMAHGGRRLAAPSWLEANIHDNTLEGFGDMLRRYSLTGKPTVQRAVAVLRADREGGDHSETQEEGPSQQTSADGAPEQVSGNPGKRRRGARTANPVAPAPAVSPTTEPPKWLSAVSAPWDGVIAAEPSLGNLGSQALTYALPPPYLFCSTGDGQARRVQNWLRVREWCMYLAYSCADQAPVLMTTSQWKIALEGNYLAVHYPKGAEILPESSVADIRRLPEAPTPQSTLGKRARSDARADSNVKLNNVERRRLRRLMERVDINVRFGVHGAFSPYRPDAQPLPTWRKRTVNFNRAREDENLWAELTWEISVTMFRLEFLALDQDVVPHLYDPEQSDPSRPRQYAIMCIWNDEYKIWDQPGHDTQDWLISPNWHVRRAAIGRMLFAMEAWPHQDPPLPQWDVRKERDDTFPELEKEVVLYYCRRFRSMRGRLPTFPLMRPLHLPPVKMILY